jgi:hypothetical protein
LLHQKNAVIIVVVLCQRHNDSTMAVLSCTKGSLKKNPVKLGTLSQQGGRVAEDQTGYPKCI